MRSLRHHVGWRLRNVNSAAAAVHRSALLLRSSDAKVLYVGAVARGRPNLGDEALYSAITREFPEVDFAPSLRSKWARSIYHLGHAWSGGRASYRALLLGGGTLIGRFGWREELEAVLHRDPHTPAFMLGVGVDDPQFAHAATLTSRDELAAWRPLLQRFPRVTVRGPRSQALLQEVGVDAQVVGDPALLLAQPDPRRPFRSRLLGVNIAAVDNIWGNRPDTVHSAVAAVARRLRASGWHIRLLVFHPDDLIASRRFADAIGDEVEIVAEYVDAGRILGPLGECHVLVGQRLHSVVLAAALAVPAIMLEYRPKCRDFMASLGCEELIVRTDEVEADALLGRVLRIAVEREQWSQNLANAVRALQDRLHAETSRIRSELHSAACPPQLSTNPPNA